MADSKKLSAEAQKIIKTLAESDKPLANKQLATATGLDSKVISSQIKALKAEGLVDSPARCKYGLTDQGKKAL